jgi:hypothetical protein
MKFVFNASLLYLRLALLHGDSQVCLTKSLEEQGVGALHRLPSVSFCARYTLVSACDRKTQLLMSKWGNHHFNLL